MAKGESWDGCRFLYVCCDYGVCQNQMLEELGKTCDTERCANRSELAAMRVGARYGQDWYRCPYCHAWHLTSKNSQPGALHG